MRALQIHGRWFEIHVQKSCHVSRRALRLASLAAKAALRAVPVKKLPKTLKSSKPYVLNVSLVSTPTIQELNRRYRRKNRPTDVLSFSRISSGWISAEPDLGDVIICPRVAADQAPLFGATADEELQRLVVHGVLHLFGYDDEGSARARKLMFSLQEAVVRSLLRNRRPGKEPTRE